MNVRPDLRVSVATAQLIVDRAVSGHMVATISNIHGGEIAAVYEIAFVVVDSLKALDPEWPIRVVSFPDSCSAANHSITSSARVSRVASELTLRYAHFAPDSGH